MIAKTSSTGTDTLLNCIRTTDVQPYYANRWWALACLAGRPSRTRDL